MLIKWSMSDTIRDNILDKGNGKGFMAAIGEKFKESERLKRPI